MEILFLKWNSDSAAWNAWWSLFCFISPGRSELLAIPVLTNKRSPLVHNIHVCDLQKCCQIGGTAHECRSQLFAIKVTKREANNIVHRVHYMAKMWGLESPLPYVSCCIKNQSPSWIGMLLYQFIKEKTEPKIVDYSLLQGTIITPAWPTFCHWGRISIISSEKGGTTQYM